jgi:hypothetical protein
LHRLALDLPEYGARELAPGQAEVLVDDEQLAPEHAHELSGLFRDDIDVDAVRAFVAFLTGPEWSTRYNWSASNPGNLRGFRTKWMKERLAQIRFLDVTTSMLPSGIPFPVIPESTEIMNIIVPEMMQNALTEKMSVADAAADRRLDLSGSRAAEIGAWLPLVDLRG